MSENYIVKSILDLIYPEHCPVCHRILKNQNHCVCPECRPLWKPIREPRCFRCGKPLSRGEEEYCFDCGRTDHAYEEGLGVFVYDREKKNSLLKYKYGGRRGYADFYAESCIRYAGEQILRWEIGGIIPVPLHPRRERERGFQQTALVADRIGEHFGIPVYHNALYKKTDTKAQKTLGGADRRKNLQDAFRGAEGIWDLENVLLFDDVYTTGSTIDAAAGEILRHGVRRVYFLTIFIAAGF